MKSQKQSKINLIQKKLEAQNRVLEHILKELTNVTDLAIGTLETLKIMDKKGYEKAIETIKQNIIKESSKTEKAKSLEKTSD
tara:strand:- start:449 stop:694 length:246 start_codon:yes stop_codon:yes gene_type:complete